MVGRVIAGSIATVALLCATLAWSGWLYLHTVGDPHRTEAIATAVLQNPAARLEIATFLGDQIVERTGLPASTGPTVAAAVDVALGDPRIAQNMISAIGAEHARALGVDDPRSTTIDTTALVDAVREHLVEAAPSIAAVLPELPIGQITLPDLHTSQAGTLRHVAQRASTILALLAILLFGAGFAIGDRRHLVRRLGTWGIFSGIGWLAGPYLVALIAKQIEPDFSATIDTIRSACQGPVIFGVVTMVAGGAVALVLWMMPIWPSYAVDGAGRPPQRAWAPRPIQRRPPNPPDATYGTAPTNTAVHPVTPAPTYAAGPVDTFVRSTEYPPAWATGSVPPTWATTSMPATPSAAQQGQAHDVWAGTVPAGGPSAGSTPAPVDVDPWAQYFDQESR